MSDSARALEVLRRGGVADPVETAIVLGTGLGAVAEAVVQELAVPYQDLPGFPRAGVSGHAGRLLIGTMEKTRVAVMEGRAHYYETGDAAVMASPLETLAQLGTRSLVITNSAGSLHADWKPGSLAMIADHINLSGPNPLIGASGDDRFVSMADAYDPDLRRRLQAAAASAGLAPLPEGVYMWFTGPSFETAAEIRMARLLGADLVGMSTVPEVILARRLGLKVAALSMITNYGTGLSGGDPSHAETKSTARSGSSGLKRLLRSFMRGPEDV